MVDMHTIGAGGGSIVRVDAGGLIQVGPESAGADPGPVCYGSGGENITVTDANLLLGRLPRETRLGGTHRLDYEAAARAMDELAEQAGLAREELARGVIRIANEHMSRALRVMSAERGIDPKSATLMSFGGAGGLHVCELAESLGMTSAVVPARSGVLSALGMLVARPGRQATASFLRRADAVSGSDVEEGFRPLVEQARSELGAEGISADDLDIERWIDCRYAGQSATLELPIQPPDELVDAFHELHEKTFGHRLNLPVELVSLRVEARGAARLGRGSAAGHGRRGARRRTGHAGDDALRAAGPRNRRPCHRYGYPMPRPGSPRVGGQRSMRVGIFCSVRSRPNSHILLDCPDCDWAIGHARLTYRPPD